MSEKITTSYKGFEIFYDQNYQDEFDNLYASLQKCEERKR